MKDKGENSRDKQIQINLHIIELINENIRLYQDNIKLNYEVKRFRNQLKEQADVDRTKFEMQRLKDDSDPVVVIVLKKGRKFIN